MALTVAQLAEAVRVGTTAVETAQITRLKGYAETVIEAHAPDAPDAVKDEALIRIVGYMYDAPSTAFTNPLRNSGAAAILLKWRVHRAAGINEALEVGA